MKIAIIVAMQKELKLMLPLLTGMKTNSAEGNTYYTGHIGPHEVSVVTCGIGKVNAALSTDFIIRECAPDIVLNSGVAGGADVSMGVLDVLVASGVAYHDVWCGPGTVWGAASGCDVVMKCMDNLSVGCDDDTDFGNIRHGLICSGDIFVSREEEVCFIKSKFPDALAVDMESGAVAQTCVKRGVPFGVIRVISDTPGKADNISQYENFWEDAPAATFKVLKRIITNLN